MSSITRRDFIQKTVAGGASLALAGNVLLNGSKVLGANSDIRMGMIGLNSKGKQDTEMFRKIPGVRIVALCDVDQEILDREAQIAKDLGENVKTYRDARELLDDKDIDAVMIATPNHWHSLLAIWACQAGKDVYVEKPISHNVWEGRQLVKAARKYDKIVQAGTQNRSDIGFRDAIQYIQEGNLGKIKWIHGLWYKERPSIGKVTEPQPIPASVDYNLWCGPAPMDPLMRPNLHYDWHWFWNTGNGDMGNLGVHQIDDCRFASGVQGFPKRIMSFGGRFVVDDNAQTPNAQFALFDYDEVPIIIELRGLPMAAGVRAMDHLRGVRMGNIIQCENGYFAGGRGGGWVYDNDNKKQKQFPGDGGEKHFENFIEAVRNRDRKILHAEVEECHYSSSLCHMANASYRTGKDASPEEIREMLPNYKHDLETLKSITTHLEKNEIDLSTTPITSGPWLTVDNNDEEFKGKYARKANKYLTRKYRKPFIVPKKV